MYAYLSGTQSPLASGGSKTFGGGDQRILGCARFGSWQMNPFDMVFLAVPLSTDPLKDLEVPGK
jgi:hypothetical protein